MEVIKMTTYQAYKLTVHASNDYYKIEDDVSEHYVIASSAAAAIADVQARLEKAGWKVKQVRDTAITIVTANE